MTFILELIFWLLFADVIFTLICLGLIIFNILVTKGIIRYKVQENNNINNKDGGIGFGK